MKQKDELSGLSLTSTSDILNIATFTVNQNSQSSALPKNFQYYTYTSYNPLNNQSSRKNNNK
jgi:hypothetical protein